MGGEAGWWTASGKIGLAPLTMVKGIGRQQHQWWMERHGCANSFCFPGGALNGDGGADLAATARIRNGWMKFREFFCHI